jgi:hypothetical protein
MSEIAVRRIACGLTALAAALAVVAAGGCRLRVGGRDPIPSTQMQDYDRMMKSGGLPRPGAAPGMQGAPGAPMMAPPGAPPGMPGAQPTAPMTVPGMQPTAPTATPGGMPGAPMVAPPGTR